MCTHLYSSKQQTIVNFRRIISEDLQYFHFSKRQFYIVLTFLFFLLLHCAQCAPMSPLPYGFIPHSPQLCAGQGKGLCGVPSLLLPPIHKTLQPVVVVALYLQWYKGGWLGLAHLVSQLKMKEKSWIDGTNLLQVRISYEWFVLD